MTLIGMLLAATILTLSAPLLTLVSGLAIPLVVGLVTKLEASTGTKSLLTVILAVVAGAAQVLVAGGGILTEDMVLQTTVTLGLALGSFYGIYSPAGTDSKIAPNWGLGKVPDVAATDGHFPPG